VTFKYDCHIHFMLRSISSSLNVCKIWGFRMLQMCFLKTVSIDYFSNYTVCKEKSVSTTQLMGFCKTYVTYHEKLYHLAVYIMHT